MIRNSKHIQSLCNTLQHESQSHFMFVSRASIAYPTVLSFSNSLTKKTENGSRSPSLFLRAFCGSRCLFPMLSRVPPLMFLLLLSRCYGRHASRKILPARGCTLFLSKTSPGDSGIEPGRMMDFSMHSVSMQLLWFTQDMC